MSLGMELGLDLGYFVLDGDPVAPSPKGERTPKFSAHVYCDQTAGWIKMPLGMEVDLGPSDILLDGDPASPSQKGARTPNFWPMFIVAKRPHGSR